MKEAFLSRFLLFLLVSIFLTLPVQAVIGTWNSNPTNSDWNLGSNWSSLTAPNGAGDIATFGLSSTTSLFLSANTEVDSIVFNSGASGYSITASPTRTLTISGAGIVNNSGSIQNLVAAGPDSSGPAGSIRLINSAVLGSSAYLNSNGGLVRNRDGAVIAFLDNASAGTATVTANGGAIETGRGGSIQFFNSSTAGQAALAANGGAVVRRRRGVTDFNDSSGAGQATVTTNGGMFGGDLNGDLGGQLSFHSNASAAQATITNNGGRAESAGGGGTSFFDNSTAHLATITNNGGAVELSYEGSTYFYDNASAANSVIINDGGSVPGSSGAATGFARSSTAGSATLIANAGPGSNSLSGGQIEFMEDSTGGTARVEVFGNGFLNIRQHNAPGVTIGSLEGNGLVYLGGNNLSIGSNNLSTEFSGTIRYGGPFGPDPTGGSITKIGSGTLKLSGSSTYTGLTTVEAGALILNGSLTGAVTVSGGTLAGVGMAQAMTVNSGGTIAPGDNGAGILTASGNLTLALGATYLVDLNGTTVGIQYDQIAVTGVVALDGATLSLSLGSPLVAGSQFIIISNDGTDAITGAFAGLSEGKSLTVSGQTFSITYQGGDGNDVVLTAVVPEPGTWLLFSLGTLLLAASMRTRR